MSDEINSTNDTVELNKKGKKTSNSNYFDTREELAVVEYLSATSFEEKNKIYNTYLHIGLPIGALCIPSLNAIDSCLFGAQYPYVYFCAKSDLTPQHDFAISLDEHNKNAQRFHRALNELKKN